MMCWVQTHYAIRKHTWKQNVLPHQSHKTLPCSCSRTRAHTQMPIRRRCCCCFRISLPFGWGFEILLDFCYLYHLLTLYQVVKVNFHIEQCGKCLQWLFAHCVFCFLSRSPPLCFPQCLCINGTKWIFIHLIQCDYKVSVMALVWYRIAFEYTMVSIATMKHTFKIKPTQRTMLKSLRILIDKQVN